MKDETSPTASQRIKVRAAATADDHPAIWAALEPVLRAGETYALPRDWSAEEALDFWFAASHDVFVAVEGDEVLGTCYIQPNQLGGGGHVANAGFIVHPKASGRGAGRALIEFALEEAKRQGYRAMQFNIVVSTNARAVSLWEAYGFEIVGRLPGAFAHPDLGDVDGLVMYRRL